MAITFSPGRKYADKKIFQAIPGMVWLIPYLPQVTFLSKTGWRVVLSSVLGILLGLTPAHRLKGAQPVANVFLYLSLCVTMSYSDLSQCTQHLRLLYYLY